LFISQKRSLKDALCSVLKFDPPPSPKICDPMRPHSPHRLKAVTVQTAKSKDNIELESNIVESLLQIMQQATK